MLATRRVSPIVGRNQEVIAHTLAPDWSASVTGRGDLFGPV
jgi:hypothetical protein